MNERQLLISVLGLAALAYALLVLPRTVLAQGHNEPARLPPLPSSAGGLGLSLNWDADLFGNLSGGVERGYATDSLVSVGLGLDTGEFGWWNGGQFALGLQAIASTHPSRYAGDLQGLSNIDASNRRQVSELWYAQVLADNSVIRAGIMDFNNFFAVNNTAGLFLNGSFGITPTIMSDIPGPSYPNSAWGVMTQIGTDRDAWLFGVAQGDPVHRSTVLQRGATFLAERDWQAGASGPELGVGTWYRHAPAAAVLPASDWGVYANFEQALGAASTCVFIQAGLSPGQVNAVPGYLAGGVVLHHVSPAVSALGLGFARAWIRGRAAETSIETTALIPLFARVKSTLCPAISRAVSCCIMFRRPLARSVSALRAPGYAVGLPKPASKRRR